MLFHQPHQLVYERILVSLVLYVLNLAFGFLPV